MNATTDIKIQTSSDQAWVNASAFTIFDLHLKSCEILRNSEAPIISYVANEYSVSRQNGLFRRSATASNSEEWAEAIFEATCQKHREEGRKKLLNHPKTDSEELILDSEEFSKILQLSAILSNTGMFSLWSGVNSGYYNQPDGSLDELFQALDFQYGESREYFAALALFEFANRVERLHNLQELEELNFRSKTQIFALRRVLDRTLEKESTNPRAAIAARWVGHKVSELPNSQSSVIEGLRTNLNIY